MGMANKMVYNVFGIKKKKKKKKNEEHELKKSRVKSRWIKHLEDGKIMIVRNNVNNE